MFLELTMQEQLYILNLLLGYIYFSVPTLINGSHEQCLPLLEVSSIYPEQQPFVGSFLLHHGLVESSEDLLLLCQTLLYKLIPQSENI